MYVCVNWIGGGGGGWGAYFDVICCFFRNQKKIFLDEDEMKLPRADESQEIS